MRNVFSGLRYRTLTALAEKKDFRTTQHIVVFESDDWGSIRMPRRKGWEELLRKRYAVDKRPYERYDTLESTADLEALYEVLSKYKDCEGNHPVITANMLMTNPDFDKIEDNGFQEYYYESIDKTYTRYFGDTKVLSMMKQGLADGLILPQSHGREHFNVSQWMNGLQNGDEDLMMAFKYGVCGIAPKDNPKNGNQIMNALRAESEEEQTRIDKIVSEGLQLFEQLWGFKSSTFVAPCYCWNKQTERALAAEGVKLIQTSRVSKPSFRTPSRFFYSGQYTDWGLKYSVRNCSFEPSTNERERSVDVLMKQVNEAFCKHKIAVFSTHRINYVGGIDEKNRANSLRVLDNFLKNILIKYPDVVFLSSDRLIELL